jgi:hypothetical protein
MDANNVLPCYGALAISTCATPNLHVPLGGTRQHGHDNACRETPAGAQPRISTTPLKETVGAKGCSVCSRLTVTPRAEPYLQTVTVSPPHSPPRGRATPRIAADPETPKSRSRRRAFVPADAPSRGRAGSRRSGLSGPAAPSSVPVGGAPNRDLNRPTFVCTCVKREMKMNSSSC